MKITSRAKSRVNVSSHILSLKISILAIKEKGYGGICLIGRGGEGLVNVKYLKIINKTFPPDDKDPTANSFNLKTRPCQRKGPSR